MVKKGNKKSVVSSNKKAKPSAGAGGIQNHLHLLLLGGVVLITFIIYLPALNNQFTNWDDGLYVAGNHQITSLSGKNLAEIFSPSVAPNYPITRNYHPLTIISLAFNYKVSGLSPFSYYLVNILFHLFNTLLVYWLVLLISRKNRTMALFTAALFAVHPMHVESVAWIAERKDVLYTFFFLGGLISYITYIDRKGPVFYIFCLILFILSSLSKPAAVVFPVILFLFDYLRRRKADYLMFVEKIPFFAISIWIGLQTIHSQPPADMGTFSVVQKFLFASYGFCLYIVKMIVPIGLSAFYPLPQAGQPLPLVFYLTPLVNAVFIAAVIYSLKYTRTILFGILFYFAAVALTLQFFQVGQAIVAERYTYLSYIGLLIVVYWITDKALPEKRLFSVKASYLLFLLFFIVNSVVAYQRVPVWKDTESIWSDVIEKFPTCTLAYNNRALYYDGKRQDWLAISDSSKSSADKAKANAYFSKAIADYSKAVAADPRYFEAYFNRGCLYLKDKKNREAVADFSATIMLNPAYSVSFLYRAEAFYNLNKPDSAMLDYDKAIQVNPNLPDPYSGRGKIFLNAGQFDQAVLAYKAAIEHGGNGAQCWFDLGKVYLRMGNYTETDRCMTQSLSYKPDYYDALTNRAIARISVGKGEEALNDLAAAITMAPKNPSAYFNRAIYFLKSGEKARACPDLQKAAQYGEPEAGAIYQRVCQRQ